MPQRERHRLAATPQHEIALAATETQYNTTGRHVVKLQLWQRAKDLSASWRVVHFTKNNPDNRPPLAGCLCRRANARTRTSPIGSRSPPQHGIALVATRDTCTTGRLVVGNINYNYHNDLKTALRDGVVVHLTTNFEVGASVLYGNNQPTKDGKKAFAAAVLPAATASGGRTFLLMPCPFNHGVY